MMGSPRQQARGNEMDDGKRDGGDRSGDRGDRDGYGGGGKIRQYPKHRAQHLASAGPYHGSSPRTSSNGGWPQHHDDGGRYQPIDGGRYQPEDGGRYHSSTLAPPALDRPAGFARENGCRVYVGNLSWEVKWTHLKEHMRRAGEVDHCTVLMEPTGRSKGCGLVTFRTVEMAREAIRTLTDTDLLGRKIFVREDREDGAMGLPPPSASAFSGGGGGYPPSHGGAPRTYGSGLPTGPVTTPRVYVSNLSWSVKWQELKDFLKPAGNVLHADVLEDPITGRSKGCGLVEFDCPEAAERAIRMFNDTQFGDRKVFIRVDREATRRPGGVRPPPSGAPLSRDQRPRFDGPSDRGFDAAPPRGYDAPPTRGFDAGPPRGFEPGPSRPYDSGPSRGFDAGPSRGFDSGPSRGFDAGPSRGFDGGPSRGFDAGPSRGFDAGPSRGFDAGPSRGFDGGSSRAYDSGPSRGFEGGSSRGFDSGPSRGFDAGPSRRSDPYNAPPLAPTPQRYDSNPAPRGYDAYDPPTPPALRYDIGKLPPPYDPYDPSPSRGGHAPYKPLPDGGWSTDQPVPSRGFDFRSAAPAPVVPTSKLFVGNVPFDASWQDMKDLLRSVANIDHVELPSAPDGRPKGYALVQCSSIPDAQAAIARLHNTEFKGRFLEVRMDRPPRFG